MLNLDDAAYLNSLRDASRRALASELRGASRVIYLGAPRHRNLGDSLIWAGSLKYLNDLRKEVIYHADQVTLSFDALAKADPTIPIVFQGGGNLGDLYPAEESFRLSVITAFPNRRFLLLPQTAYFQDDTALARSTRVYEDTDVTVLVRDRATEAFLAEAMPTVRTRYCVDFAFGVDCFSTLAQAQHVRVRAVARNDKESKESEASASQDWTYSWANRILWSAGLAPGRIFRRLPAHLRGRLSPIAGNSSLRLMDLNLRAAGRIVNGVSALATNRLHAHILCCLAGVPHFVSDNSYGKVGRIFHEYSGRFTTAHWCETLTEATDQAGWYVQR